MLSLVLIFLFCSAVSVSLCMNIGGSYLDIVHVQTGLELAFAVCHIFIYLFIYLLTSF